MSLKGKSLLKTPWMERHEILQRVLPSDPLFRLSDSFDTDAATIMRTVREFNLEGASFRFGEGLTVEKMAECVWVKPEVVVQIDYTEWTDANHLRGPRRPYPAKCQTEQLCSPGNLSS